MSVVSDATSSTMMKKALGQSSEYDLKAARVQVNLKHDDEATALYEGNSSAALVRDTVIRAL